MAGKLKRALVQYATSTTHLPNPCSNSLSQRKLYTTLWPRVCVPALPKTPATNAIFLLAVASPYPFPSAFVSRRLSTKDPNLLFSPLPLCLSCRAHYKESPYVLRPLPPGVRLKAPPRAGDGDGLRKRFYGGERRMADNEDKEKGGGEEREEYPRGGRARNIWLKVVNVDNGWAWKGRDRRR